MARKAKSKTVETIRHEDASRRNIPTAEYQSMVEGRDGNAAHATYLRRNRDLDPQLVWRGKDEQDLSDLVVAAPPLYIQEKVHPKVLIDDLIRRSKRSEEMDQPDLFGDFNGLPSENARTEFYQHDQNWSNRMILGDSLQVMASLAEREGLRGKVQCIFMDPPYGIKFNSNFQWSTTSRDVIDGNVKHLTREPEQVKAFRDTWMHGIHSYLTYLRDRLTVARDLLSLTGSVFLQIGDENVHRVRAVMDEVFGDENFVGEICFNKTTGFSSKHLSQVTDYVLWYRRSENMKFRKLWIKKVEGQEGGTKYKKIESIRAAQRLPFEPTRLATSDQLTSQGASATDQPLWINDTEYPPKHGLHWKTTSDGLRRLYEASRVIVEGASPRFLRFMDDFPVFPINNVWMDVGGVQSRTDPKVYVVQTNPKVIERCILMTTDPGDLVMDPTCGSGTTARVAEQWGRRWITMDTSRVALALARARIMGSRFPYYQLADSEEGRKREEEVSRQSLPEAPTNHDVRQGFVYRRVPHITLRSIANNAEIDVIRERYQNRLDQLRHRLDYELGVKWEEWEVPRDAGSDWPEAVTAIHRQWWGGIQARQQEIDASISAHADQEYLYDAPYENSQKVRVAGPFTVESTSPHRVVMVEDGESTSKRLVAGPEAEDCHDFTRVILDNLKQAGIQQVEKSGKLEFDSIQPWPGDLICAEGAYRKDGSDDGRTVRAGIFIGPEFGTVSRPDIAAAAREAREGGFEALVSCAFSYDAHTSELDKLGPVPILKARMNADLHMADDLKSTGKGNLFVVFGEPDIEVQDASNGQVQVKVNGVDVYHPGSGEIRSSGPEGHSVLVCRYGLQRGEFLRATGLLPRWEGSLQSTSNYAEGRD